MNPHFTEPLLQWFDKHGRKDLPWQHPRSAYRVWISEVMLQQTQVKTVIPYFQRFLARFPDLKTLADASIDDVLALWSGLGYYRRGHHLHQTARLIQGNFKGVFPSDVATLMHLPGIGASTAAAIAAQAFDQPTAILDGNVKRVLSRYFLIGGLPSTKATQHQLWQAANRCMPKTRCADYTQAIMDMGSLCCTTQQPTCLICPVRHSCLAHLHQKVEAYPEKKPPKNIPTKHQQFILLHTHDSCVYLERRPDQGLWSGLWCPPTVPTEKDLTEFVCHHFQAPVLTTYPLMRFKHTFSHFKLELEVIAILTERTPTPHPANGAWFDHQERLTLGLPKPVSRILDYFNEHQQKLGLAEGS
jgi:A/G-specific adenine glycosylase